MGQCTVLWFQRKNPFDFQGTNKAVCLQSFHVADPDNVLPQVKIDDKTSDGIAPGTAGSN